MALTKITTDLDNIQALSDKPNEIEGLTPDQLKAKFDEAGNEIKDYLNDTLTAEVDVKFTPATQLEAENGLDNVKMMTPLRTKQAITQNLDGLIERNGSAQTVIGLSGVRATRFVALPIPLVVVNAVDPANTNWTSVDVTSSTSARCFAITGTCTVQSTGAARILYGRTKGDTTGQVAATYLAANPVAALSGFTGYTIGVDTNQEFEYSVSNADVTAVNFIIRGYWEYVD